ncbi:MAG: hypothetical protein E4G91_02285, partial [Candidatus Zixiibacteriota bacterium]
GDVRQALAGSSGTLPLSYSTYLGGGDYDNGNGVAIDASGNSYATGYTHSSDFPTLNPYQTYGGNEDVFVTKLSSSGNSLIYSTYVGGSGEDRANDIAVDSSGNAYVTGYTQSSNFPTRNPYQTKQDTTDAFVTRLSGTGNSMIYSTYVGGGDIDVGYGIAVDGGGNAYVTGYTSSSDFPTSNPYQTDQGDIDAFVTKLSNSGSSLIYSTYLGGGDRDGGHDIAVDGSGNAYVTGDTWSTNFPILNAYQDTHQGFGGDVFITKFSYTGNTLIYSTLLGGFSSDNPWGIAVDGSGYVYVAGYTASSEFPTKNPYQGARHSIDAFVSKLGSAGDSLVYSTFLGGWGYDFGGGIAVDGNGNAYVAGVTDSRDFPIQNPYQTNQDTTDAFVVKFSESGSNLIYSTYLGGASSDFAGAIAVDGSGKAYVTGGTFSSDFPTLNPYQTMYQGNYNAFVTKLTWTPDYPCGDVNTDEQVDLLDAVFLINYIFVGGPAPQLLSLADVNCSGGTINIADVVLMINYIFRAGPAPCAGCK